MDCHKRPFTRARLVVCLVVWASGWTCSLGQTAQAPLGSRVSLRGPAQNGTVSSGMGPTLIPVQIPANMTGADITLILTKTPSNSPLVKLYCNPVIGTYALNSARSNYPRRDFHVWKSVTLPQQELLQIAGSSSFLQQAGIDPTSQVICALVNDDLGGQSVSWQLEAYAEKASQTLNDRQQQALNDLYVRCCQSAPGACANWPIVLGRPLVNFCGGTNQRCDTLGSLVALDLSNMNLTCTLPDQIFAQFATLTSLNLAGNPLLKGNTSQLFDVLASMPALHSASLEGVTGLAGDRNISSINLQGTFILGSLPDCLYNPSSLISELYVGSSQLSGTLPSISPASRLQTLSVSNAMVTGNLPVGAEAPQSLTVLDLSRNTLLGTLPAGLATAIYLKQLNLSSNKLIGTVPNALLTAKNLAILDLQGTDVSSLDGGWAGLASSLTESTGLMDVNFAYTNIQNFPSGLAGARYLTSLRLSNSRMSGLLPELVAGRNFPALQLLEMGNNQLNGTLPASWQLAGPFNLAPVMSGSTTVLNTFNASGNMLTGTLPAFLANASLPSIVSVHLSGNLLDTASACSQQFTNLRNSICVQRAASAGEPPQAQQSPPGAQQTPVTVSTIGDISSPPPGQRIPVSSGDSSTPPAQVSSQDSSSPSSGGLSGGAIAGIIIAVIAAAAILALALLVAFKRRRNTAGVEPDNGNAGTRYGGLKAKSSGLPGAVSSTIGKTAASINPLSGRKGKGFQRYRDEPLAGQLEIPELRDPEGR